MSRPAIDAPSAAKRAAVAAPIPDPAPVISATRPSRRPMSFLAICEPSAPPCESLQPPLKDPSAPRARALQLPDQEPSRENVLVMPPSTQMLAPVM